MYTKTDGKMFKSKRRWRGKTNGIKFFSSLKQRRRVGKKRAYSAEEIIKEERKNPKLYTFSFHRFYKCIVDYEIVNYLCIVSQFIQPVILFRSCTLTVTHIFQSRELWMSAVALLLLEHIHVSLRFIQQNAYTHEEKIEEEIFSLYFFYLSLYYPSRSYISLPSHSHSIV